MQFPRKINIERRRKKKKGGSENEKKINGGRGTCGEREMEKTKGDGWRREKRRV